MADQLENDHAEIRKLLASIGLSADESITVADQPPKEIDEINQILMSIGAKAHPYSKAVLPLACPDDANAQAAIARIREIGKSGDSMVKVMAASVLSDLTGDRSLLLDALNSSLQKPDETVRMLATSTIGDLGSAAARAVPRLVEMLRGHGSTVHVSLALSEIGPAAVPLLLAALDTADPGKFAEILMILCEMIPAEQSCIDAFLRGLCHLMHRCGTSRSCSSIDEDWENSLISKQSQASSRTATRRRDRRSPHFSANHVLLAS